MPSLDFESIKRAITIDEVMSLIGWKGQLEPRGTERGPCPVHGSKNPKSRSFCVTGQEWYCHGCKQGGGVLELYRLVCQKPIYEATLELCERLGRPAYHLPRFVPPQK